LSKDINKEIFNSDRLRRRILRQADYFTDKDLKFCIKFGNSKLNYLYSFRNKLSKNPKFISKKTLFEATEDGKVYLIHTYSVN